MIEKRRLCGKWEITLSRSGAGGKLVIEFLPSLWRYRLKVRTVPSQGTNPGSSPGIATKT
jgi:hypothetical protein